MSIFNIGDRVPDFKSPSTNGSKIGIEDFIGEKNIVLFFYPKDNTPGWTNEASEFRDLYQEFKALDTEILGISKDNLKSHNRFKEKLGLPYELLSDEDRVIHRMYDVLKPKKMFGKEVIGTIRSTFLIDKNGNLIKEFRKVKVNGHAMEVLNSIKELAK